jgi:hypothetical protein
MKRPRAILARRIDAGGTMAATLFEWLAKVCSLMGWSVMRAHDLLDDTRWSDMYEAGLTPEQAAERARAEKL